MSIVFVCAAAVAAAQRSNRCGSGARYSLHLQPYIGFK
jgi:hypothetical protein